MKIELKEVMMALTLSGLNPYSNGMKIESFNYRHRRPHRRLNPYSNGMKIE